MTAARLPNSKRHLTSSLLTTVTLALRQGWWAQPRASKHNLDGPWRWCLNPEDELGPRPPFQAPWASLGPLGPACLTHGIYWPASWLLEWELAQLRTWVRGRPGLVCGCLLPLHPQPRTRMGRPSQGRECGCLPAPICAVARTCAPLGAARTSRQ